MAELQAVPELAIVQSYFNVSPVVGGERTLGPPVGAKSLVIFRVIDPLPPLEVRTLYVKLVVPV
jgi:hypothetical protein